MQSSTLLSAVDILLTANDHIGECSCNHQRQLSGCPPPPLSMATQTHTRYFQVHVPYTLPHLRVDQCLSQHHLTKQSHNKQFSKAAEPLEFGVKHTPTAASHCSLSPPFLRLPPLPDPPPPRHRHPIAHPHYPASPHHHTHTASPQG